MYADKTAEFVDFFLSKKLEIHAFCRLPYFGKHDIISIVNKNQKTYGGKYYDEPERNEFQAAQRAR